ncbi:uncharacterized protein AAG666_014049 isoform 2-T4 [Megaptera novaeangliae]
MKYRIWVSLKVNQRTTHVPQDQPLQKNQIPLLWPGLLCYGWSDCFTLRSMLLNLGSFLKCLTICEHQMAILWSHLSLPLN